MELLVTLRKKSLLEKVTPSVDGVIIGRVFTSGYHYTLEEIRDISTYCHENYLKCYIAMDNFISEDDLETLDAYLAFLRELDISGIYFHDLGVMERAIPYGLLPKLIYDGKTVLCNSLDTAFMLKQGIGSAVISRELTLSEVRHIIQNNSGRVDMQIFGHLRLSYSRRKFLTNYFKQIGKEYDYLNKETLKLVEEKRDYALPIVEDDQGTMIYSDYIFEMVRELVEFRKDLRAGIIETLFMEDENLIVQICRDFSRLTIENKEFIRNNLIYNHPDNYATGFLYQKTNINKDE
ncbi:MAG: U32 family peptidase [Erysipelotrichaceae bacterium]|nr:U32 family peptidase [Erysipelotrichaceae bacterium]